MHNSEHIITMRHYLILSVIAFACGIIFATNSGREFLYTSTFIVIFILAVSVILLFLSNTMFKKHNIPPKTFITPIFLTICLLLGIFRIVGANILHPSSLDKHTGGGVWLTGTIISEPKVTSNGYSSYFQLEIFELNDQAISPEKIMIFAPKERGLKLSTGEQVCCWTEITAQEYDPATWPYNYQTQLRSNGIFHSGSIKNANPAQFSEPKSLIRSFKSFGESIATKVEEAIDSLKLGSNEKNILKGILIGDKSDFTDELYQSFSFAGLSHIVAVSGMHLSILFTAISLLLSKMRIRKRVSVIFTMPLVIIFAATAQFTPSVCRAAIMILMMLVAIISGKRYSSVNALFLSLGIILCVSPYSIYSRSLTLSFGATLGILVYYKYIYYFLCKLIKLTETSSEALNKVIAKFLRFCLSSLSVSLSVTITTVYFSLMFFESVSWIQILTNLWIIPVVMVTFCLGYIVCLAYYLLPPLSYILNTPLNFFLEIISDTADYFGKGDFTAKIASSNFPWTYFVAYCGFAVLLYLILKKAYDLSESHVLSSSANTSEPGIPRL